MRARSSNPATADTGKPQGDSPRRTAERSPNELTGVTADTAARLEKLGLRTWFDLVLHLPLRYEDETRMVALRHARIGATIQTEANVVDTEVRYRPRRQLVVRAADGGAEVTLRFLNFYPSQLKQFTPGARIRLLGEIRGGMFGAEMVHPRYRVLRGNEPLPAPAHQRPPIALRSRDRTFLLHL